MPAVLLKITSLKQASILFYTGCSLEHVEGTEPPTEYGRRSTRPDLLGVGNQEVPWVLRNATVNTVVFNLSVTTDEL